MASRGGGHGGDTKRKSRETAAHGLGVLPAESANTPRTSVASLEARLDALRERADEKDKKQRLERQDDNRELARQTADGVARAMAGPLAGIQQAQAQTANVLMAIAAQLSGNGPAGPLAPRRASS